MNQMKSLAVVALVGALGLGVMGSAQAQSVADQGGFVQAKVGNAHWNGYGLSDDRVAYGVSGGYRFNIADRQSIGPEIGYVNFGKPRTSDGQGNSASVKGEAYTVGANYRYRFDATPVSFQARAGYARWHGRAQVTQVGFGTDAASANGNGWYAGLGVGYDFNDRTSLVVVYDYERNKVFGQHINTGTATAGVEVRF